MPSLCGPQKLAIVMFGDFYSGILPGRSVSERNPIKVILKFRTKQNYRTSSNWNVIR